MQLVIRFLLKQRQLQVRAVYIQPELLITELKTELLHLMYLRMLLAHCIIYVNFMDPCRVLLTSAM